MISLIVNEPARQFLKEVAARSPLVYPWGYFFACETSVATGSDGCFCWFESRERMLEFIQTHQVSVCPLPEWIDSKATEDLLRFACSYAGRGKFSQEEALHEINRSLEDIARVEWWGEFHELAEGDVEFSRRVRTWYRSRLKSSGPKPIPPVEWEAFAKALREYRPESRDGRELTRGSPAEVYDRCFVPALFRRWASVVADAAAIGPGQRALDVACGTGTLACAAVERVGGGGAVWGVDPSDEMLAVARRNSSIVEWRKGRAEELPFPDASFDAVVSQFGFMFFEDQPKSLAEMMRVLRPGGRLAVAVCDALDHSPGYAVLTELLHRLFGTAVAEAFRAPFSCGSQERLLELCGQAGIVDAEVTRHDGQVRFSSIRALVSAERACVWTLGGLLDDAQFDRLLEHAEESLHPFVQPDGGVSILMPALIVTAEKGG